MELQSKQDISVSLTSLPDKKSAEELAETLVSEGLAACVTVLDGANSIYSWEGKLEKNSEVLLIIKSQTCLTERLAKRISELHSYDTPEFLSVSAELASKKYGQWVKKVTKN